MGKTNKAADALSQCPVNHELEIEDDSEDPVVLSYATIFKTISMVLGDVKIPYATKKEVQAISHAVEGEISTNVPDLPNISHITLSL